MAALNEQPYYLDPDFEDALTWKCITSHSFFGRIGKEINPDLLGQPHSKLLVRAAHIVSLKTGKGPASATIAVQTLSSLSNDGKLGIDDLAAVKKWVTAYKKNPDATAVDEGAIIAEIVPLLQKRMKHAAAQEMFNRMGKGGDTTKVVEQLSRADNLGLNDTSIGVKLGKASFEQVRELRKLKKLKTGIVDLDFHITGLTLGHLGIMIGGPGDGKSMGLIHVAASAMRENLLVAYATLELDEAIVLSRLMANITGIPIDAVMDSAAEKAEARIAEMQENGQIGGFIVKYFTPQATTVEDIKEWCAAIKEEYGRVPDLLVIDYLDKMGSKQDGDYLGMRDVTEGLRIYGRDNNVPIWTASQAKAKGKDHKQLGLYSAADSMHKVRVADLVITLNVTDDRKEIRIHVAKNRVGEAGQIVGPLPTAFALGRLVNIPTPGVDYAKSRKKISMAQADMSVDVDAALAKVAPAIEAGTAPVAAAPTVKPAMRDLSDEEDSILMREIVAELEPTPAPVKAPPVTKTKAAPAEKPVPVKAARTVARSSKDHAAELEGGWRTDDLPEPLVDPCDYCGKAAIAHGRCAAHAEYEDGAGPMDGPMIKHFKSLED